MEKTYFIIPVYKVEDTIDRCVKSVLGQSAGDFEIVLVDDGSPDGSGRRCDEWAARDFRIRALHRKNGGLGAARNTGIDDVLSRVSSGWIAFLDSDDWLDSQFLERMLGGIYQENASIAICRYWRPKAFETHCPETERTAQLETVSPEEFFSWCGERETEGLFIGNMACAKLYDLRLWQSIRFPDDGKAHEDMFTTYKVLFRAERIVIIDYPLYAYFINPSSITGGGYKWTPNRINAVIAGREQVHFMEKNGLHNALIPSLCWHFGRLLWNLEAAEKEPNTATYRAQILAILRTDWKRYRKVIATSGFSRKNDVFRRLHPFVYRTQHLIHSIVRRALRLLPSI